MILLRRKKHHVVENHVIEIHVRRGMTVITTHKTNMIMMMFFLDTNHKNHVNQGWSTVLLFWIYKYNAYLSPILVKM